MSMLAQSMCDPTADTSSGSMWPVLLMYVTALVATVDSPLEVYETSLDVETVESVSDARTWAEVTEQRSENCARDTDWNDATKPDRMSTRLAAASCCGAGMKDVRPWRIGVCATCREMEIGMQDGTHVSDPDTWRCAKCRDRNTVWMNDRQLGCVSRQTDRQLG